MDCHNCYPSFLPFEFSVVENLMQINTSLNTILDNLRGNWLYFGLCQTQIINNKLGDSFVYWFVLFFVSPSFLKTFVSLFCKIKHLRIRSNHKNLNCLTILTTTSFPFLNPDYVTELIARSLFCKIEISSQIY